MTLLDERWLVYKALVDVGRPLILEHFSADTCVIATKIAIEALDAFNIDAAPLSVDVIVANEKWVRGREDGTINVLNRASWPADAYSVGIGLRKDNKEAGHLVAVTETELIDLSIDQASRPDHNMTVTPLVIDFVEGECERFMAGHPIGRQHRGNNIVYKRDDRRDVWWTQSGNWGKRDRALRKRIVAAVVKEARRLMQDESMLDALDDDTANAVESQ